MTNEDAIRNVVRSVQPLGKPETGDQKKLWSACKDFESIFIGQMLKQMRDSVQTSDPLNQGAANKMWRGMLDDETAKTMSKSGGIGLAEGLYRQMVNRVE